MRKLALLFMTLLVAAVLVFVFRIPLKETLYAGVTRDMFIQADTDSFDPGPALGSDFPGLNASYDTESVRLLEQFAGPNGTVLVASRSLDWCPYCMKQLLQLQEYKPHYDAAGIALVSITYDSPELQRAFADKHGIDIPILSDTDAMTFKTLGILNEKYAPGDMQYGIPHPGMIIVDRNGRVAGKLFVEAYSSRVSAEAALAYAERALGLKPVGKS